MRILGRRKIKDEYKIKVVKAVRKLQPGDIVIYHGTSFPSWAIRTFTGDEKTHTSLYLGCGKFGEAIYYHFLPLKKWGAIENNPSDYSFRHCKKIEIYRPKTSEENKQKAIKYAKKHTGNTNCYDSLNTIRYGIKKILDTKKSRHFRKLNEFLNPLKSDIDNALGTRLEQTERKNKFYCSNLAIEAYKRNGFDILENVEVDNTRMILPKDIVKSERLERIGEFSFT